MIVAITSTFVPKSSASISQVLRRQVPSPSASISTKRVGGTLSISPVSFLSTCAHHHHRHQQQSYSLMRHIDSSNFVFNATTTPLTKPRRLPKMTVSSDITDIEELHRHAILQKQSTYIDPTTGFTVFTELAHLKRGKCCGNLCRHCPYGYSNVKNATNNDCGEAKAVSGDREGTGKLVMRILDGTYYENDESSKKPSSTTECGCSSAGASNHNSAQSTTDITQPLPKVRGKGGYAGGTLTSKNVPYTRKGDAGTSQLFTGERRDKHDDVFEAMGTVDELCSVVGVVYSQLMTSNEAVLNNTSTASTSSNSTLHPVYGELPEQLLDVMSRLFDVGSHIARPAPKQAQQSNTEMVQTKRPFHPHNTDLLEEWIDTMTDQLPELTSFVLPTGSPASAQLHVARTVCRRAERRMVPLVQRDESCDPAALSYVNRLSDYLFTAARYVNYCDGRDEMQYRREERRGGDVVDDDKKRGAFQRERVAVKLKDSAAE